MKGSMHAEVNHILLDEAAILKRVKELGKQIAADYAGEDLLLVCILKGAVVFFSDLARHIDMPCSMEFMGISSYGDEMKTSGIVRISKDVDTNIMGRNVLIVEDIMDSGLTLNHLKRLLTARNPKSLRIVCLLDKPERRECDIVPDYCGFTIPNEFVVGYGLDYQGKYRNLAYVGVLKPEIYAD